MWRRAFRAHRARAGRWLLPLHSLPASHRDGRIVLETEPNDDQPHSTAFRAPMALNGVIGMLSLLSDTRLTVEQREYVDVARASLQKFLSELPDDWP